MANTIVCASVFLVIFLTSTSIGQNNAPVGQTTPPGLLDNKLQNATNQKYNDFDWGLSKVLNAKERGNFVVSPLSVKLAIAMLYLGIKGSAAMEIEQAFAIDSSLKETVEQKFSSLMKSLEAREELYELNIGTNLFVDDDVKINTEFSKKIKDSYKSNVQEVQFANKPATVAKVNEWCNKITKGKIPQLISGGEFSDDTVMMLLNAIYFRGEWQFPFAPNETKSQSFSVARNKQIQVQMMSLKERFGYYDMKEVKAHLIRLPYMGDKFAMYIIYPYEVEGLALVAKELNPEILSRSLKLKNDQLINLRIPKFKFESCAELVDALRVLGIKEIFSPKANFEMMGSSSKGPLMISTILQKSGIEVNEKGSTAFAATNVVIDSRFGNDAIDISITHPFIFLIADESQNNIIFIGKVVEPLSGPSHNNPSAGPSAYNPAPAPLPSQTFGYPTEDPVINRMKPKQTPRPDLIEKYNYFDKELLIKTHQSRPNENIALSPASIKVMLGMLLEGAAGNTEKEIRESLRLPEDKAAASTILQSQFKTLKNSNSVVTVDTKNRIFLAPDEKLLKRYGENLVKFYEAEFESVNFNKQDEAANTINKWVSEVTDGLITSLVGKEDLDTSTRLLLANCIYFKGDWDISFDPKLTHTNYFYNGETDLKAKFMTAEMKIKFHEDRELDAKVAEIPFKDDRYTFTAVLPNKRDGVSNLLRDLQHYGLLKLFSQTKESTVKVTLPKTLIQFKTKLADILSSVDIGIKDAFTPKANLTGMLENNKPITVKDIFHNAKIEITEEGAKAAAASGSQIVLLSANFAPEFKADHPFIYFIRDTHDSGFLFEGVLFTPDASNDPVMSLSVDNRINSESTKPSTQYAIAASAPPARSTPATRRPQTPGQQSSRPNNNQATVSNRINGAGNPGSGQQTKPIIGFQTPRPSEPGSVEYPIREKN